MRVVALISGGKDSCFNMMKCVSAGHEIVALANLKPEEKDELDSFMYQTVGHDGVGLYAEAMGLPLYRGVIEGTSVQQGGDYTQDVQDEVEDLFNLLQTVKKHESVEGVAVGAILSNYQRVRVEHVCKRLGLKALCYLWRRDQEELLDEMIACGIRAILIKVAALGLTPEKHLGKELSQIQSHLVMLKNKFGNNVCGEGGEYETFTLDCPLFIRSLTLEETETVLHSDDPISPVAYLRLKKLSLREKKVSADMKSRLEGNPVRTPLDFCEEELANPSDFVRTRTEQLVELGCKRQESFHMSRNNWVFVGALQGETTASLRGTFQKLADILQEEGSSLDRLVSVNLFIRSMDDYAQLNQIYDEQFQQNPPVRACVEIPLPESLCYILEAVAIARFASERKAMHVQSISHWAPANIGPYSQAVEVGDLVYLSGQIGLIPGSMQLPEGGNFEAECRLALRHVTRVMEAIDPCLSLHNSVQVICYVVDVSFVVEAKRLWNAGCSARGEVPSVPVTCIVVPRLPRGALVEWQIIAHRQSERFQRIERVRDFPDSLSCSITVLSYDSHSFITCTAGKRNGPLTPNDWTLIENEIDTLDDMAFRVYCKSSVIGDGAFQNSRPSTWVPVSDLEENVQLVITGLSH